MEIKKQVNKEPKSVKVIQTLMKSRGFDNHRIIDENKTEVVVAFGYEKHNHSELIKYNFSKKTSATLVVDGELSFDEFVVKAKDYAKK